MRLLCLLGFIALVAVNVPSVAVRTEGNTAPAIDLEAVEANPANGIAGGFFLRSTALP
jgi:hypothetical protein